MKLKVYVVDLEIPANVRRWALRIGIFALLLGGGAVALAAGPLHTWVTGDVLNAADLNGNFANLQAQISSAWVPMGDDLHNANASGRVGVGTATPSVALDVNGGFIRKIARAHGVGPNDPTTNGALVSRLLAYNKTQAATGLRVTWTDNLRCAGPTASCEWEIKIDGASCAMPGPIAFDVYNGAGAGDTTPVNNHRAQTLIGTCFGISAAPHTIQIYVKTPVTGEPATGTPYTGWSAAYWSLEAEEVY